MLNDKMESAINSQINAEIHSAYLYLSMSAWFESKNLKGFANWMKVQFQEEMAHADKFFNFVLDRGGKIQLTAIKAPKTDWKDVIDVVSDVLKHEQLVTSFIDKLMTLAIKSSDHASASFLKWFVDEQVEEESNASNMLEQLKLIDGKGAGLFMLDKEAAARVFVPPAVV